VNKLSILKCPSGKYTFVGDVPLSLCRKNEKRSFCGSDFVPKVYETKAEAEKELSTITL
jgi:hypothetical protein